MAHLLLFENSSPPSFLIKFLRSKIHQIPQRKSRVFRRYISSLGHSRAKRESSVMVVSWDSIFVQLCLTTEQIFRVKEIDCISTLYPFLKNGFVFSISI